MDKLNVTDNGTLSNENFDVPHGNNGHWKMTFFLFQGSDYATSYYKE